MEGERRVARLAHTGSHKVLLEKSGPLGLGEEVGGLYILENNNMLKCVNFLNS